MRFAAVVLTLMTFCACHSVGLQSAHADHHFTNAQDWAQRFDDPARDEWQKPDEVLKTLALAPDALVADIGAATGYFSVRLARAAPRGHVYGIDIESSMVEYLSQRAERESLQNLTAILAEPADAKIPQPVDVVIIVNTYHHIDNRTAYFARVRDMVKPNGKLVVIDFNKRSHMGPPASAKFEPAQVTAELEPAGWALSLDSSALPEQFFLVYTRS